MAHVCLNCGHKFAGKFCNECGQKAKVKRLDWHYLVHEIPHSFLHLDKGFFYTVKEMLLRPGKVISEYLDGKRVKYFSPLTYLILLGTVSGLVYINAPIIEVKSTSDPSVFFVQKFTQLFGKNYNLVVLGSIPFFAFVTWLFYRKERNFIEISVAHFYIFGTINLSSLFTIISLSATNESLRIVSSLLTTILTVGFQIWSYTTMFKSGSTGKRIGFGLIITIICSLISIAITVFLVFLYLNSMIKENPDMFKDMDVIVKPL